MSSKTQRERRAEARPYRSAERLQAPPAKGNFQSWLSAINRGGFFPVVNRAIEPPEFENRGLSRSSNAEIRLLKSHQLRTIE